MSQIVETAQEGFKIPWSHILTSLGAILSSGLVVKLVQGYNNRKKAKVDASSEESKEFREHLKKQVGDLEADMAKLRDQVDELLRAYEDKILKLTAENSELKTRVEYLKEENARLKKENARLKGE